MLVLAAALALAYAVWRHRQHRSPRTRRRRAALVAVVAVLGCYLAVSGPAAEAAECGDAPNPQRPGSGLVGVVDPGPSATASATAYDGYGYAGLVWNTYETDCGPLSGLTDPTRGFDTSVGNFFFDAAKGLVAVANGLHYAVMDNALLAPIDHAVDAGAHMVYDNIYTQLFALCALLVVVLMFWQMWRGDLAAVSRRGLYTLAAVWLAASSFTLLRFLGPFDTAVVQTTTDIQAGFLDDTDSSDHNARDALPEDLHQQIVYKGWLRGEFGSPDAPQAAQYGMALVDAQAFTRDQLNNHADADPAVTDGKKAAYKDIATKLRAASGYFTGESGGRAGAGFLTLLQGALYASFQILAKLVVLSAQVLLRLLVITAPLLGLIALFHPDILHKIAKAAGVILFHLIVISVLAGVHALLLRAILTPNALPLPAQICIAAIVATLFFLAARPLRRLGQTFATPARLAASYVPAIGGRFGRFPWRNGESQLLPHEKYWQQISEGSQESEAITAKADGRVRPEAVRPTEVVSRTRLAAAAMVTGGRAGVTNAAGWLDIENPLTGDPHSVAALDQEVESTRQWLLRKQDVSSVRTELARLDVNLDVETIQQIKKYNFDSRGIAMDAANYTAWQRLATGRGQIRDAQYIVHEQREVAELEKIRSATGFDYMGRNYDQLPARKQRQWTADFDRAYKESHRKALESEYDFLARQVQRATNGHMRIGRVLAAVADTRHEGRTHMLVDGVVLEEHAQFTAWSQRANRVVSIGSATQKRLGLGPAPTLRELVAKIRNSRA